MKSFGDESGIFWDQPVVVGRSSANGEGSGSRPKTIVKKPPPPPPEGYQLPTSFPNLSNEKRIYFDLETYDPDLQAKGPGSKRDGYIVGYSLRTDTWRGEYYPIRHDYGPNLPPGQGIQYLKDTFKGYRGEVVGSNLLYEGEYADAYDVDMSQVKWKPVDWAEALLDENQFHYGIEYIAQRRLGKGKVKNHLVELYGEDYIYHMQDVHPGHMRDYGLGDLDLPMEILPIQEKLLAEEGMTDLFDMECRLMPFLLYLRKTGVRVNVKAAEKFNDTLESKVKEELAILKRIAGFDLNPNAGDDIAKAFTQLGLPYQKTAKGNPTFTAPWLNNHPHEIASHIVAARKYRQFKGTFIEGGILDMNIDGRLYTQFHPLKKDKNGTVTGRLSSSNPNLQNIPFKDDVLAPLCRSLFIPEEGQLWWSLDYSQIEYRLLVHYAVLARCVGAEQAAAMYWADPNTDFHALVSILIWGTADKRNIAKNINFGFVYGMGVWLLAYGLGMIDSHGNPLPEAYEIFEQYHSSAPFIKQVYNMATNRANDVGFVRTILSRKRRFHEFEPWGYWKQNEQGQWIKTNDRQPRDAPRPPSFPYDEACAFYGTDRLKRAFTYAALNAVLQGSAADLIKLAMVRIWEAGLVGPGKPLQCHLTVHDELNGSQEDSPAGREALEEVRQIMINVIKLKVPILVKGVTGRNWAEAKD
jgi:DNA polymerase-1